MFGSDIGKSTPVAQSLLAKVQLGLPGTVTKLGSKMRFIDRIAPLLRQGGVIRYVDVQRAPVIRAAGIATGHKTTPAFGGILYSAGALRQDIYLENGSIYQTYQDSIVDIDEIDDIDVAKKMKFVHIVQTYRLLEELLREEDKPDLVIVDTPLVLEQNDVPLSIYEELHQLYKKCVENIESFWEQYQEYICPFNSNGIYLVSLNNKRFGAIFYGLTSNKKEYILDEIDGDILVELEANYDKIKRVGVKKLLNGALTRYSRTAAYEYDLLTDRNRLQPKKFQDLGLISFHFRAGMRTLPHQVEMIGSQKNWDTQRLDEVASQIISLIPLDQPRALPLPLWYAQHSLKPIGNGTVLEYYKAQAREMIKNEEVENIWKEELDIFGEEANE